MAVQPNEPSGSNMEILAQILEAAQPNIEGAVTTQQKPLLQEIISKGDDEFGSVMVAKVYQDAGVVPIYDLHTGARSLCPVNLLPANLTKVDADGNRMFTSIKPAVTLTPVKRHKCLLHPEEREPIYDDWGLPTCSKDNIADPLNLELHMQRRHPMAWNTIQREKQRLEKEEERGWQKQIAMAAVRGNPERPAIEESETPSKKGPFGRPLKTV